MTNNTFRFLSLYEQSEGFQYKMFVGGKRPKIKAVELGHKLNKEDARRAYNLFKDRKPIPKNLQSYVDSALSNYKNISTFSKIEPIKAKPILRGKVADKSYAVGETCRSKQYDVSHQHAPASKGGEASDCLMEKAIYNRPRGNEVMTSKEKSANQYDNLKNNKNNFTEIYGKKELRKVEKEIKRYNAEKRKPIDIENATFATIELRLNEAFDKALKTGLSVAISTAAISIAVDIIKDVPKLMRQEMTQETFEERIGRSITRGILRGIKAGSMSFVITFILQMLGVPEWILNVIAGITTVLSIPKLTQEIIEIIKEYKDTFYFEVSKDDTDELDEIENTIKSINDEAQEATQSLLRSLRIANDIAF